MKTKQNLLISTNYWPGFTDLLASLLLFIVFLLFVQYLMRWENWQTLVIKAKQRHLALKFSEAFPEEIRDSSIIITEDGNLQRISYSNQLLFGSGATKLQNRFYLDSSACMFKSMGDSIYHQIIVEGYTDSLKLTPKVVDRLSERNMNNWDLSCARAVEVVCFLQEHKNINADLLSAAGFSYYQSNSNSTRDDRARNRKIEIVLVYSQNLAMSNQNDSLVELKKQ